MLSRTHSAVGLLCGTVLITAAPQYIFNQSTGLNLVCLGLAVGTVTLGAKIPDIDTPYSSISRALWFIALPIQIIRFIILLISFLCPNPMKKILQGIDEATDHRGITHSIISWFVFCIGYYIAYIIILQKCDAQTAHVWAVSSFFLSVGYLSHLLTDFISGKGIPLFCPISNKRFGSKQLVGIHVKYNGLVETVIRVGSIALSLACILNTTTIHII